MSEYPQHNSDESFKPAPEGDETQELTQPTETETSPETTVKSNGEPTRTEKTKLDWKGRGAKFPHDWAQG